MCTDYISLMYLSQVILCVYLTAIQITRAAPTVSGTTSPRSAPNKTLTTPVHLRRALCDHSGGTLLMGDLSLCPWTMQTNENRFRHPMRIKLAECVYDRPLDFPGLVCRPVYRDTEVKIRSGKAVERLPVACTAVPMCD